jgi:hypothetical protein
VTVAGHAQHALFRLHQDPHESCRTPFALACQNNLVNQLGTNITDQTLQDQNIQASMQEDLQYNGEFVRPETSSVETSLADTLARFEESLCHITDVLEKLLDSAQTNKHQTAGKAPMKRPRDY